MEAALLSILFLLMGLGLGFVLGHDHLLQRIRKDFEQGFTIDRITPLFVVFTKKEK